MKLYQLAIALVCLSATVCAQEPPTKPATAAPQTQDSADAQKQLERERQEIRNDLEAKGKEIDAIKKALIKLDKDKGEKTEDEKTKLDRVIQQLAQLTQLTTALDDYNRQAKKGEVKLDQLRYGAGGKLLKSMIEKSGTLKVTTSLSSSLGEFQTSVNPTTNPIFRQEIDFLIGKLRGTNNENLLGPGSRIPGLISNPYVSMAFAVGALIFSNYRREDSKLDRAANIACVIDYTSRAAADAQFIQASIKNLDAQVGAFQTKAKRHFADYAEGIEKETTWEKYQEALRKNDDFLKESAIEKYFNQFTTDGALIELAKDGALPQKLSKIRFQLEKVKALLLEYELLMKQVEDFFSGFALVVKRNLEEADKMTLCSPPLKDETKKNLTETVKSVEKALGEFRDSYSLNSLAPNKSELYGIK